MKRVKTFRCYCCWDRFTATARGAQLRRCLTCKEIGARGLAPRAAFDAKAWNDGK